MVGAGGLRGAEEASARGEDGRGESQTGGNGGAVSRTIVR